MLEEINLLNELKEKVRKTPDIDKKKKEMQLIENYAKFLKNNSEFDKKEKELYTEYSKKIEEISAQTDKIIKGEFELSENEIDKLTEIFGKDMGLEKKEGTIENEGIKDYWKTVLKNADLKWGSKDDELMSSLKQINITNKIDPETKCTLSITADFVFDFEIKEKILFKPIRELKKKSEEGNIVEECQSVLWVRTLYNQEILKGIECSGINWVSENPLIGQNENKKDANENKNTDYDKDLENKVYESFLDLFDEKCHFLSDKKPENIKKNETLDDNQDPKMFHMINQEIERIVDEMGNVVAFSLEYYLGIVPQIEFDDFDNDFDDED